MKKNKRDYSKCFICGSNHLWSGEKQNFCLECKGPASNKCFDKSHKYCPPNVCHHKGRKDYFSICYACYGKIPLNEGRWIDWNWIIEKQNELEIKKYYEPN